MPIGCLWGFSTPVSSKMAMKMVYAAFIFDRHTPNDFLRSWEFWRAWKFSDEAWKTLPPWGLPWLPLRLSRYFSVPYFFQPNFDFSHQKLWSLDQGANRPVLSRPNRREPRPNRKNQHFLAIFAQELWPVLSIQFSVDKFSFSHWNYRATLWCS